MKRTRIFCLVITAAFLFTLLGPVLAVSPSTSNGALAAQTVKKNNGEERDVTPEPVSDPIEGFNRAMFSLNDHIFYYALKPFSTVYSWYFPEGVRVCIRNSFHNFAYPIRFMNCVFQGRAELAGTETARFVVNSTLGVGGMFDPAEREFNLHKRDKDFGLTLARWGAKPGFYLVLPVLGPGTFRDWVGWLADSFMDPIYWITPNWWSYLSVESGNYLNRGSLKIADYEDLKRSALDPYVSMREAYYQWRAEEMLK